MNTVCVAGCIVISGAVEDPIHIQSQAMCAATMRQPHQHYSIYKHYYGRRRCGDFRRKSSARRSKARVALAADEAPAAAPTAVVEKCRASTAADGTPGIGDRTSEGLIASGSAASASRPPAPAGRRCRRACCDGDVGATRRPAYGDDAGRARRRGDDDSGRRRAGRAGDPDAGRRRGPVAPTDVPRCRRPVRRCCPCPAVAGRAALPRRGRCPAAADRGRDDGLAGRLPAAVCGREETPAPVAAESSTSGASLVLAPDQPVTDRSSTTSAAAVAASATGAGTSPVRVSTVVSGAGAPCLAAQSSTNVENLGSRGAGTASSSLAAPASS